MQQIQLTKDVLKTLRPALWGAKGTIKSEIMAGISQLFITDDKNLFIVVRPEGKELVVVAVVGKNLVQSQGEIIRHARTNNFTSLRFHTLNPKHLAKGLQGLTPVLVEKRPRLLSGHEFIYRLYI